MKRTIVKWIFSIILIISICEAEESHFGVQGAISKFADEMKEAGIEITREWIEWDIIEPKNNQYNWDPMDEKVRKANEAGIEILGYFNFTPSWAQQDPDAQFSISPILNMDEFREFAKAVAKRYDGKQGFGEMKYIGILNEVTVPEFFDFKNDDYGTWLINGYEGVKDGNDDAVVLIGAFIDPITESPNPTMRVFIDDMLANYHQYYNIINFHSYSSNDEGILETIQYVQNRMEAFDVDKPMWITETATLTSVEEPDWKNILARGVIKRYSMAFEKGISKVFWFSFVSTPTPEEHSESEESKTIGLGWALKDEQVYHPRPAYNTYKLMTSKLAGFNSVDKISDSDGQYKFTFSNKNHVYVLWRDNGSSPLPPEITGTVIVTDYLGNEEIEKADDITLTENPIFVEIYEERDQIIPSTNEVKILGGKKGYINPMQGENATILFKAAAPGVVTIKIYTTAGLLVWETSKDTDGNEDSITWNCTNSKKYIVSSGIYILHINCPGIDLKKKIAIVK